MTRRKTSTCITAVNTSPSIMVQAYWHVGKLIVEAQGGEERAAYGEALIKELSVRLTADFGKGFTPANIRNMRQFYIAFPNCYALRSELSWTHYRLLMRVANPRARAYYEEEAAKHRGACGSWDGRSALSITSGCSPTTRTKRRSRS